MSWFTNYLKGDNRKIIEEKLTFFNKIRINSLFKDLNNIYKHFIKSKNQNNLEEFEKFNDLTSKQKEIKMEEDMTLILYLLIELERFNKKK